MESKIVFKPALNCANKTVLGLINLVEKYVQLKIK
jgi:hypothetical protein